MSIPKYALSRGIGETTVRDRIKSGSISERAIVRTEGSKYLKIDEDIADADFAANHSPQQKFAGERSKQSAEARAQKGLEQKAPTPVENSETKSETPKPEKKVIKAKPILDKKVEPVKVTKIEEREIGDETVEVSVIPEDGDKFGRYRNAKTSTEELRARKLELEVALLEESLLGTEEVRAEIMKLTGETRETFLNMSARLAPILCSIKDPVEMENRLADEINLALESLGRIKYVNN